MEEKGRWKRMCMLRCAEDAHDKKTAVDRIMLGFRPIAPKPIAGGNGSANCLSENNDSLNNSKRTKRKYVRVRKNNGYRRKSSSNKKAETVTLQLLPEKKKEVECKDQKRRSESLCSIEKEVSKTNYEEQDTWLGFGEKRDRTVVVVESRVTVESVTGGACIGKDDDVEIKKKSLDKDTCPWFISAGGGGCGGLNHNVKWVNDAYKKMVTGGDEVNGDGKLAAEATAGTVVVVKVSLMMKERLPSEFALLTCRARVEYTWQKEKKTRVVPCDVLRTECGECAWRLDVDAALSLGR